MVSGRLASPLQVSVERRPGIKPKIFTLIAISLIANFLFLINPAKASSPIQVIRTWEPSYLNTAGHFVYFEYEYTKGVEFWNLNQITSVTCTPSVGTCLEKGSYTLASAPASRFPSIRVADLPNDESFTVTVNISTAPKSDLSSITTESLTHYYRYNSPISGHDLTPTLFSSGESFSTNNVLSVTLTSQRSYSGTYTYPSLHSCFVNQSTCDTSQEFLSNGTYNVYLQIGGYTQGETVNVSVHRHWNGTKISDGTSTNPPQGTHISTFSFATLKPGLNPQITNLKSEIGGCSLQISNYDSNFTFYFKRLDSEVSISSSGFVRLSGQADGTSREDYPSSSRTGYITKNNTAALFTCIALTTETRIQLEEEERRESERLAAEEAARQAEIRRQNAINFIVNVQPNGDISINTFRDAGIYSVLPETLSQINAFVISLQTADRSNVSLIENRAKELRTEFFFSKLEQDFSYLNLVNLQFTSLDQKIMPELVERLKNSNFVKERNFAAIQRDIDVLNVLFKGRDSGTLSEADLAFLGINLNMPNKKSEILIRFRTQSTEVFRDSSTVQSAITQIEELIQARLDRTNKAKEKTRLLREKIKSRSGSN